MRGRERRNRQQEDGQRGHWVENSEIAGWRQKWKWRTHSDKSGWTGTTWLRVLV